MKKWEEIVKSKVEVSTETLPDKLYSEFLARLDAANAPTHSPKSSHKLLLALAPVAAIGLAVLLFLSKPNIPEGGVQIIQQPAVPIAIATDTGTNFDIDIDTYAIVNTNVDTDSNTDDGFTRQPEPQNAPAPVAVQEEPETPEETAAPMPVEKSDEIEETSPFIPEKTVSKAVKMEVLPAAGAVVGGGLLAALVIPYIGNNEKTSATPYKYFESSSQWWDIDIPTGDPKHSMPLKVGLSTRIPVWKNLSVTTGLEYSRYSSLYTYYSSGEKEQVAHYVGIPLRLDLTFAFNKWLNVYAGAGIAGDWCIAATLAGNKIDKDGFCLSVLGAGGIQLNVSRIASIYLEPVVTWTPPQKYHIENVSPEGAPPFFTVREKVYEGTRCLETYRTEHPFSFSIATGIRITLGK